MTEREAYFTLPNFLGKLVAQQFSAGSAGATQSEDISSWTSAVNFPLHAYGTDENMHRAVEDLRAVHQRNGETEAYYAIRLEVRTPVRKLFTGAGVNHPIYRGFGRPGSTAIHRF